MFSESAELYDAIYGTFKDYNAECEKITRLVRERHPSARTLLDIACGTGEHARVLRASHGFAVDGLDLDPGLLAIARSKVPEARFFEGDMSAFALPHRYDVVACLFSSIGYLITLDRVTLALRCFRDHLASGGVVIVEPWLAATALRPGYITNVTAEANGVRVERTSRIEVTDRVSELHFDYRIESSDGVRTMHEVHRLGLFTVDEMMAAFADAGLAVSYDPKGLTDRGLYLAQART